jgi:hypothetical protein
MEPLSIILASISIAKFCESVVSGLKRFIDETKVVETTLTALCQDVEEFKGTLELLRSTLDDATMQNSIRASGFIGNHWTCMKASLDDADSTLVLLQKAVDRIDKSVSVMDSARKQIRVRNASSELDLYRGKIRSFHNTIHISLQSVMLYVPSLYL